MHAPVWSPYYTFANLLQVTLHLGAGGGVDVIAVDGEFPQTSSLRKCKVLAVPPHCLCEL